MLEPFPDILSHPGQPINLHVVGCVNESLPMLYLLGAFTIYSFSHEYVSISQMHVINTALM